MIAFKQILLATDFSECSVRALDYALTLADISGASLHVLHVHQIPVSTGWGAEAYVAPPVDLFEQIEQEAREQLDKALTDEQRTRARAEVVLRSGNAVVEIIQYAKAHDIDMIVMGTHGRGPVGHVLMGSVAEKVIRKAPCPVLVVRESDRPPAPSQPFSGRQS